jgi:hypothetical protein
MPKGFLFYLRINSWKILMLVFGSLLLTKFTDLDQHWSFCRDPDPQKMTADPNTAWSHAMNRAMGEVSVQVTACLDMAKEMPEVYL